MAHPDDRFGLPDSAFLTATDSHGTGNAVLRLGMDVPAYHEIASMPADTLHTLLIDWLWESPSELIPSNTQIAQVRALLLERPDAADPDVQRLVIECDAYLKD